MDFIIDEAEVSDEIYSEKSDCSDNEGLLDDFVVSDQNCQNDPATFYRKCQNFHNRQKMLSKKWTEMKIYISVKMDSPKGLCLKILITLNSTIFQVTKKS